jgi:hypothetical protein
MRLLKIATVAFVVLSVVTPVSAGDVNTSGELGLFTLRSGHTYGKGQWGFSLYGNEWDWRVPEDDFWKDFDPLWSNWDMRHRRASVGVGFGLTDRFELDLSLPYEWYKAGHVEGVFRSVGHNLGQTYVGEIDQSGLGDIRVGAAIGLTSNDRSAVALRAFIDAPTGDDDEFVVTGELGWGLGLAWSAGNWVINGAYHDLGDPDLVSDVPISGPTVQEVSPRVELGLGYGVNFGERWEWITEVAGDVMTESTGEHDRANIATGGRYNFGTEEEWAFNFGVRLDLSASDFGDTAPIGGLVGITYSSAPWRGPGADERQPAAQPPPPAPPTAPPAAPSPPPPAAAPPPGAPGAATHNLNVRKEGTGNGTVTSTPAGIDCGSDCRETYPAGTSVRLAARPDACSTSAGFGGDCSSDGSVTMSSDKTCTATFNSKATPQTFAACEKYGAWDCQGGARETVAFTAGSATLASSAATANGRGILCDWANQLRACPELRLCVAGSTAASEEACIAGQRSETLVQFFRRQSGESAFSGIASRVQAAPSCSPEDEKGSLGNLQLR